MTLDDLIAAAKRVHARAYAPYSGFHVGAVVLSSNNAIYSGCNVENVSFPEGTCAEAAAISAMVAAGDRAIERLILYAEGNELCTPCGGCRQRIAEFAIQSTQLILVGPSLTPHFIPFSEIFPAAFGQVTVARHRCGG